MIANTFGVGSGDIQKWEKKPTDGFRLSAMVNSYGPLFKISIYELRTRCKFFLVQELVSMIHVRESKDKQMDTWLL